MIDFYPCTTLAAYKFISRSLLVKLPYSGIPNRSPYFPNFKYPMRESAGSRLPSQGASIVSRELCKEISSFLVVLRGKLLSLRQKQILIMLAIFVVATAVLQIDHQSFFHDMKTANPNVPRYEMTDKNELDVPNPPSNVAKKTVTTRNDNTERHQDPSPRGRATKTDHMENTSIVEESKNQNLDSASNAQPENEHNNILNSRDKDESNAWNIAAHTEQVSVEETEQKKRHEGSVTLKRTELDSPTTSQQSHASLVKGDYEDGTGSKNSYNNIAEQQELDEAAGDKNKAENDLALAGDNISLDRGTAINEAPNTSDSSEHDVLRNRTSLASTNSAEDEIRNLHSNQLVKDIGCTRTKCYSVSGEPRQHICAPSVVVAGYEKCGTSALYYKLALHPEIVAHPKWKENCPGEDSLEEMWSWFHNIPVLEHCKSERLLLNGCIGIVARRLILKELQRLNPKLKVLVALRNYADWSYSFYGYRCYPGYDEGCEKLKKPYSHGPWKETRTPENFAKMVMEIQKAGKSPYEVFEVIQPNAYLFRPWLEELLDIVGQKAVKIIKQEDLSYRPRETLADVARYLEINSGQFVDEAYTLVSNTHDQPAEISSVNATATKAEMSYMMNSGSAILNETRSVLNKFWRSECEWLRDKFDVHFSEVC